MSEEGDGEPVDVACLGSYSFAAASGEGEAEEAALDACDYVGELVHFVFDQLYDLLWQCLTKMSLAHRPLPHNVDERLSEYNFGARQVPEAQVRWRVLCDLLEEP